MIGRYHLAITGKCWSIIQEHYPELVPRCVVKGTIFARMSPDQKQQLVQALQQLNYVVGKLVEFDFFWIGFYRLKKNLNSFKCLNNAIMI